MAITQEQVNAAAERIVAAGKKPSVAAVRGELGTGSMSTIAPLLKAWKDSNANAVQEQAASLTPDATITAIRAAVDAAIRDRVVAETAGLVEEVAAKDTDIEAYQRELKENNEALEEMTRERGEIAAEAEKLRGTLEERERQAQSTRAQLEAVTAELTAAQTTIKEMELRLTQADEIHAKQAETAENVRKLEGEIQRVTTENEILKQDADELRILRQERPALQSKADRYDETAERLAKAETELAELRELLAAEKSAAAESQGRAEEAKARLEEVKARLEDTKADKTALQEQLRRLQQTD